MPHGVHEDLKEIHDEVCRDRAPYWQTVDRALKALESEVSE